MEIFLQPKTKIPISAQVYNQLRAAIVSGRLQSGDKLPSTRELSAQLRVSRNTVSFAYERLLSEGYLESRRGSGTYVTRVASSFAGGGGKHARFTSDKTPASLAAWARGLVEVPYTAPVVNVAYDFRPGALSLEYFPEVTWRRIAGRHLRRLSSELGRYGDTAGYHPLREAICNYLKRSRAVVCDPDQVVITTGSQQTLYLLARLILGSSQMAVIENPCFPSAAAIFRAMGATLHPVKVDNEGVRTDLIPRGGRLMYVTPSHQYPTGVVLSLARRVDLLERARKYQMVIVEDDYDCEFRYSGRAVECLQSLDQAGLVVYIGSFSNLLFPSLRLGYAVLPRWLVQPFLAQKWITDRQTPVLEQRFLADFLLEGHFEKYLRKMRKVYEERREALIAGLAEYAGDYIEVAPSAAGLHLTGWLKTKLNLAELKSRASKRSIGLYPLTPYYLRRQRSGLVFGYAAINTKGIWEAVRLLARIFADLAAERVRAGRRQFETS